MAVLSAAATDFEAAGSGVVSGFYAAAGVAFASHGQVNFLTSCFCTVAFLFLYYFLATRKKMALNTHVSTTICL